MVIGPQERGIPVASLITSSERRSVLVEIFKSIKETVKELEYQYCILGGMMLRQYFNAFNEIFGCQRKLLCKFHVILAWGSFLKRLVNSKVKATEKDRATIVRKIWGLTKKLSDCKDQHRYRDAISNLKKGGYVYYTDC